MTVQRAVWLGILLLAAGLWPLLRRLLHLLRSRSRSEDRAAALAVLGILTAAAVHEMLDFGLTMPANALTLAVLAGAALSVEVGRRRSASAEPHGARLDAPAAGGGDLEEMIAGAQVDAEPQPPPRTRRKRTQNRSVQP